MTRAFYAKCRPQDADIGRLALKHGRVFVGYPVFREGATWSRSRVRECLLDISSPDFDPSSLKLRMGFKAAVTKNRDFATKVIPGDIVVMPRPAEGICYLGRIAGKFELVDDPPWADEYLRHRQELHLPFEPESPYL